MWPEQHVSLKRRDQKEKESEKDDDARKDPPVSLMESLCTIEQGHTLGRVPLN